MNIRPLSSQHAHLAAPLILESGKASLRAMFDRTQACTALGFLNASLQNPYGQFGFERHWGLFDAQNLIGVGSCWTSHVSQAFKQATLDGLVQYYGWELTHQVLDSSARIAEIIPSLHGNELGIGHLAVAEDYRGKGHVHTLLDFFKARAAERDKSTLVLDVEAHNTTAIQAYHRYGFETVERFEPSSMGRKIGLGPHLHMCRSV